MDKTLQNDVNNSQFIIDEELNTLSQTASFHEMTQVRYFLAQHAKLRNINLRYTRSTSSRLEVHCVSHISCPFHIKIGRKRGNGKFIFKTCIAKHSNSIQEIKGLKKLYKRELRVFRYAKSSKSAPSIGSIKEHDISLPVYQNQSEERDSTLQVTKTQILCSYCKQTGHNIRRCQEYIKKNAQVNHFVLNESNAFVTCSNCKVKGHNTRRCPVQTNGNVLGSKDEQTKNPLQSQKEQLVKMDIIERSKPMELLKDDELSATYEALTFQTMSEARHFLTTHAQHQSLNLRYVRSTPIRLEVWCATHIDCPFTLKIGRRRSNGSFIIKFCEPYHSNRVQYIKGQKKVYIRKKLSYLKQSGFNKTPALNEMHEKSIRSDPI